MPSEYVMYLSMLLVGALAIAGISATMMSLNNTLEDRAIVTELEGVMQKLSEIIHNMMNEGQKEIENGAKSINMVVMVSLPEKVQEESYVIQVNSSATTYQLYATLLHRDDISASISLFIPPDQINLSGTLSSSSLSTKIRLTYDGQAMSILLES